jgi:hypothetical protein
MLRWCEVVGDVASGLKLRMMLSVKYAHSVMGVSLVALMYHRCASSVR